MKNQIYIGKADEIAGGPPKVFRREKAQGGFTREYNVHTIKEIKQQKNMWRLTL